MKNSLSLLSIYLLFLALGLSSCKKEYTCYCTHPGNTIYDGFLISIQETPKKAEKICNSIPDTMSTKPICDLHLD